MAHDWFGHHDGDTSDNCEWQRRGTGNQDDTEDE
jgi:hypothetical protein